MYGYDMPLSIYVIQKFSDSVIDCVINSGDRALWLEHFRTGARSINSVSDMVSYLVSRCANEQKQIADLHISGHGNSKGFRIGNADFITLASLPSYRSELSKLIPLFIPDASVYIEACETGQNPPLLREFSRALGGVVVTARLTEQSSWVPSGPSDTEQAN